MKVKRALIVATGLILLSATGLSGCGKNRELTKMSADTANLDLLQTSESESGQSLAADPVTDKLVQLTALADSQDAAQEIADLYGIELKSYSYGVATYTTDKNLQEILDLGQENDYPELTPDHESQLYTTQSSE